MKSVKAWVLGAMMAAAAVGCASEGEPGADGAPEYEAEVAGAKVAVKVGLLVRLEAKEGAEGAVEALLKKGPAIVANEPGTKFWFGLRLGPRTFGIFDAFPNDDGRDAHLAGKLAAKLFEVAPDVLAQPPTIEEVDVLAQKDTFRAWGGRKIRVGLAARLEAKQDTAAAVKRALVDGVKLVNKEEGTPLWFAIKIGPTTFGIVDAFENDEDRQTHLASPFAQGLLAAAPQFLAEPPTIEEADVLGLKDAR
jgi:quinol monooxygenase YgiN